MIGQETTIYLINEARRVIEQASHKDCCRAVDHFNHDFDFLLKDRCEDTDVTLLKRKLIDILSQLDKHELYILIDILKNMMLILFVSDTNNEYYSLRELKESLNKQVTYCINMLGEKVRVYNVSFNDKPLYITHHTYNLIFGDRLSTIYIYETTKQIVYDIGDVGKDYMIYDGLAISRIQIGRIGILKSFKPSSIDIIPGSKISPAELAILTKNIRHCADTVDFIMKYFNPNFTREDNSVIVTEKYEDENYGGNYEDYVIELISKQLDKRGVVGVHLANDENNDDKIDHNFILYKYQNNVYRIESYVYLYCARVVENNDYGIMLKRLLDVPPGEERLSLWNKIFNATEIRDTDNTLDVILYV